MEIELTGNSVDFSSKCMEYEASESIPKAPLRKHSLSSNEDVELFPSKRSRSNTEEFILQDTISDKMETNLESSHSFKQKKKSNQFLPEEHLPEMGRLSLSPSLTRIEARFQER